MAVHWATVNVLSVTQYGGEDSIRTTIDDNGIVRMEVQSLGYIHLHPATLRWLADIAEGIPQMIRRHV